MRLRPGSVTVLEGLDKAGKTTQREALKALTWEDPAPLVTHMPSGLTGITRAIYETTEHHPIASPLARQLLHLACHAENLPALREARKQRALILDRWWWSTVAYGLFGGLRPQVSDETFLEAIGMVWKGFDADVVFLFSRAHEDDRHNSPGVVEGYGWLPERYPEIAVDVPSASVKSTTEFLLRELSQRDLLKS